MARFIGFETEDMLKNKNVSGLRMSLESAIISPMSRLFQPSRHCLAVPFLALVAIMASAAPAQAPEKVTLRVKGEVGKSAKYASKADFVVNFQGETLKLSSEETSETKVTKVNSDGSVEFDLSVLTQKVKINGEDLPEEDDKADENGSIYTLNSRGITIATKEKGATGGEEDESDTLNVRLSQATSMVFAQEAVTVGSAWTHKFAANKDWGTLEGTSQFKLISFETVGGEKTAKIEFTYSETETKGIKGRGTHWVELNSGDVVKSENSFEQVPFDFGSEEEIVASLSSSGSKTTGSLFGAASATQPAETKPAETKPDSTKTADTKPAETKPEEDKNSIDFKTKGWEKFDGLFTLYRKVEESRTRHFLEIKKSQLGQLFILQTTASSGNSSQVVAGDPVNDLVFTFEETPTKKIFLKVPNYSWQSPGSAEMEKVLQRSFSDSYIESFDIEGRQPDRDSVLIDISQFFLSNISQLSEKVQGGGGLAALLGGGGGAFSPDREKSYIKTLKVFPTNLYAEASFNFSGRGAARGFEEVLGSNFPATADARGLTVQVVYNLFALPKENGFKMRRADSRVGYFQTAYRDWSNPEKRDQVVQNIIRWNLVKKDPKAELSEPVTPITFWVDNAFPEKYRKPVSDAILSWNKAFERIGFKNAVVVKQIPDKAEFDHADMRYNVIRFVASPGDAYAVANARVNPITGEILNASITLDANFLRAIKGEWDTIKPAEAFKAARAKLDAIDSGDASKHTEQAHSCARCDLQKATASRAAMGAMAIMAKEGAMAQDRLAQFEQEYLYSVIQHEMGHILGLRHNFVASNQLTMAQLADPALVQKHNTTASVMDYIPYNSQALGRPSVPFFGRDLGDYDYWAIRYGYFTTGMNDVDEEAKVLAPIAALGARWGLGYQSDEQADGLDPFTARFDMSADPLAFYEAESKMAHKLLMTLGDRKPGYGESYYEFTRAFNGLLGLYTGSVASATRYLGGVRRTFAKKGDPGAGVPFNPVSGNDQRRALDLMVKGIFDEKVFNFPKSYYRMFQANPKAGFMESMLASYDDYAVMDQISAVQQAGLNAAFSRGTLSRIMNFDWKAAPGEKPLTVKEVFEKMGSAVWSELWTNGEVSILRRQLHRAYLDKVIDMGVKQTSSRTDINLYAWAQLKELHAALGKVKPADEASRLHYAELRDRAGKALNAVETLGGGGSRSGAFDLASLLGRPAQKATAKKP